MVVITNYSGAWTRRKVTKWNTEIVKAFIRVTILKEQPDLSFISCQDYLFQSYLGWSRQEAYSDIYEKLIKLAKNNPGLTFIHRKYWDYYASRKRNFYNLELYPQVMEILRNHSHEQLPLVYVTNQEGRPRWRVRI